jgi:hypothetical protein
VSMVCDRVIVAISLYAILSVASLGYSVMQTVVLQWCYSGVTVVLQWCYIGVTLVLQWCYSGVTVVLQWQYPCKLHSVSCPWPLLSCVFCVCVCVCVRLCVCMCMFVYVYVYVCVCV